MTTGVITSEPSPDWQGDTLAADATTSATSLTVDEALDFDDDPTRSRWLVVGESDPLEYTAVDYDTNTITLAAPTTEDYEAGLPVVLWDPTAGAKVIEYLAPVRLTDGSGTVDAVIRHELIPLNGIANLVGASVSLTEDGGEWYVSQVFAREARVDGATVDYAATSVYLTSDMFMGPASTWTRVEWPVGTGGNRHFRAVVASSPEVVTVPTTGRYLIVGNVQWAPDNVTGGRAGRLVLIDVDGTETVLRESFHAPSPTGTSEFQVVRTKVLEAGQGVALDVRYTTGADISPANIVGSADETATALELVLVAQI